MVPVSTYSRMRPAMDFPMPLDLGELGGAHLGDVVGELLDGPLGVVVGADPEGLGAALVDLGELGQLAEQARHLVVGPGHRRLLSRRPRG
jgi:hypothetical protein